MQRKEFGELGWRRLRRRAGAWPPRIPDSPSLEHALRKAARRRPWTEFASSLRSAPVLFLIACLPFPAPATGASARDTNAGSLVLFDAAGRTAAGVRLHTSIEVRVSGLAARVRVTQQFDNPAGEWIEGEYVYPLPESAALDSLRMDVNGRVTVGEIREQEAASTIYREARNRGQRASLIEQRRPNLFRTRVANTAPGERVEVSISYTERLDLREGEFRLRIPLAITPRYAPESSALHGRPIDDLLTDGATADPVAATEDAELNPPFAPADVSRSSTSIRIDLDAGMPVTLLESHHHAVVVEDLGGRYAIELADGPAPPERDFELSWRPLVGAEPEPALFLEQLNNGWHALIVLMPPQEWSGSSPPRDLVFVIDTSGSMHGESLAQAKAALLIGLEALRPQDSFNVIRFDTATESLFRESVPAARGNLHAAQEYVRSLRADGGTEMAPALQQSLKSAPTPGAVRQVVFITDGAVGNEEALFAIIESGIGATRLFTVGIGAAPNGHFMRAAARAGRGSYTFIGSAAQVRDRMAQLLTKIGRFVITDVEVSWPNGTVAEMAPGRIGDLYAGEPLVLLARLDRAPHGLVTISGRSRMGAWTRQIPVRNASSEQVGIAKIWGRRRIEEMLDDRRRGVAEEHVRAMVLPLALEYQLVSPYTSLVAVEHAQARLAGTPIETSQIAATMPAGSGATAMVLNSLPRTATSAPLHLLLGSLLMVAGVILLARVRGIRS